MKDRPAEAQSRRADLRKGINRRVPPSPFDGQQVYVMQPCIEYICGRTYCSRALSGQVCHGGDIGEPTASAPVDKRAASPCEGETLFEARNQLPKQRWRANLPV